MAIYKLKYKPHYIVYYAISKYLTDEQNKALLDDIAKYQKPASFYHRVISNHFDIEQLRVKPIIAEDIWIYNYILYDLNSKKNTLLKKYEQEVILPEEKLFREITSVLI